MKALTTIPAAKQSNKAREGRQTTIPAAEQSKTYIEGVFSQESRSLIGKGIYCV